MPCAIGLPFAGMFDPVTQGVLWKSNTMKTKDRKTTAAQAVTNNGSAQGAANTTKGNGYWRVTRRKGERVLVDPSGHIYHGTAQEVRDVVLMPFRRKQLADSIRFARCLASNYDYTPEERRECVREKRLDAISRNENDVVDVYPADIKEELAIVAKAAARNMGQTFDEFIADAVDAAVRGTIDVSEIDAGKPGSGLPLTRHERAALDRIKRDKARILAAKKRRMAAWNAAQAARLAKSKAKARATA